MPTTQPEGSRRPEESPVFAAEFAARKVLDSFRSIPLLGIQITAPYWMNYNPDLVGTDMYKYFPRGGKNSPEEITEKMSRILAEIGPAALGFNHDHVRKIMVANGLGVDCSGFTYHVCKAVYESLGGIQFETKVFGRRDGEHGVTKTGASDLTGIKNSLMINDLRSVKPGDIIKCAGGIHVIAVLGSRNGVIACAHSSNSIFPEGVHEFGISITDTGLSIFRQEWTERNKDGLPYNIGLLEQMREGDGIWRLKVLNGVYESLVN